MSKHEQKYKLICLDVDGVLVEGRDFWMDAHKAFGTYDQGKALTKKYLHNDYQKLVEEVVHKLWKGKDATPFLELVKNRKYMKGIKDLFELIKKITGFQQLLVEAALQFQREWKRILVLIISLQMNWLLKMEKSRDIMPEQKLEKIKKLILSKRFAKS